MPVESPTRIALRLHLATGACSIPLHRVHRLTGFATLSGVADDYFRGWLTYHGVQVPVFDLNRVVCDEPTPELFGSRIVLLPTPDGSTAKYIGLLAGGMTDTVAPGEEVPPLALDAYLPMLYTLIPAMLIPAMPA